MSILSFFENLKTIVLKLLNVESSSTKGENSPNIKGDGNTINVNSNNNSVNTTVNILPESVKADDIFHIIKNSTIDEWSHENEKSWVFRQNIKLRIELFETETTKLNDMNSYERQWIDLVTFPYCTRVTNEPDGLRPQEIYKRSYRLTYNNSLIKEYLILMLDDEKVQFPWPVSRFSEDPSYDAITFTLEEIQICRITGSNSSTDSYLKDYFHGNAKVIDMDKMTAVYSGSSTSGYTDGTVPVVEGERYVER
jgi:hypothetical protein